MQTPGGDGILSVMLGKENQSNLIKKNQLRQIQNYHDYPK